MEVVFWRSRSEFWFLFQVFIYEFIAMMVFVFCINMSADIYGSILALWAMVIWSYPISGGHVNPAITFGIYIKGKGKYLKNLPMSIVMLFA